MATKKTTTTEIPKKISDSANAYIDRLAATHERFAEGVETTRERSARITDKVVEAVIAGQRDAIKLTRTVAAAPTDYSKNMEAVMESFTSAQERTLDVAKTLYREQAEAGAELRGLLERTFESSKAFTKPFAKMNEMWAQAAK